MLADPSGELSIQQGITKKNGRVLLAVGPEGGWVDYETQKFKEYGFSICNMGNRILKVDTAVIVLHAYISAVLKAPMQHLIIILQKTRFVPSWSEEKTGSSVGILRVHRQALQYIPLSNLQRQTNLNLTNIFVTFSKNSLQLKL